MPFPTVKSNPWKKGLRKQRLRFQLWPEHFWKKLCEVAKFRHPWNDVPIECQEMIHEINLQLYGEK